MDRDLKGRFYKGHRLGFKVGYIPWNKGTKGLTHKSELERKQISLRFKNKPSPLKGKKRPPFSKQWRERLSLSKKGKKIHTIESRKKISKALSESKSYLWKGGKPKCKRCGNYFSFYYPRTETCRKCKQANTIARSSWRYTNWRKAVFERDNYTCQECGVKGVYLHADHIKSFAYYPELRFELSNGRTLCIPCHKKTPTWGLGSNRPYFAETI